MSNINTSTAGALNAEVAASPLENFGTIGIQITGTWVGTLSFQGSLDGTNYVAIRVQNISSDAVVSSTTANGQFVANALGMKSIRAIMTVYSSGTANISMTGAGLASHSRVFSTLFGGTDGAVIGNTSDRLKVDTAISATGAFPHINRIDVASAARTVSGNSGTLDTEGMGCLSFDIQVTASSGTNPIMDIFVDASDDGTNWAPFSQSKRFTTTGSQRFQGLRDSGKYYRYRWVIAGTTPSFTFSIVTTLKSYLSRRFTNKIQYNFDLTQAVGTTSEVFNSADSPNISLMTIRGTDGGTNAAYRVQVSNDDVTYVDITGNIAQGSNSQNISTYTGAYRFYRLYLNVNPNAGTRVMDIHWAANG